MKELIPFFPREVAYPERILCLNEKEFYSTLNKLNHIKKKVYFGLYNCDENRNFTNTIIDKISFDIDCDNGIEVVKKIVRNIYNKNYRFCIIFSTKGFWVHIKTINGEKVKNKKATLKNAQLKIINDVGLKVGTDIDPHVLGDIRRVARMPCCYDGTRDLYCISITLDDIEMGYEYIKEKAKNPNNNIYWYGTEGMNILPFDYTPEYKSLEMKPIDFEIKCDDRFINSLLPCVKNTIINLPLKGHNSHWVYVSIYLKEKYGFGPEQIKKTLRPYLEKIPRLDGMGRNEYEHYITHDHLPESIFSSGYYFPKCDILYEKGFCIGKCQYYNKRKIYLGE